MCYGGKRVLGKCSECGGDQRCMDEVQMRVCFKCCDAALLDDEDGE